VIVRFVVCWVIGGGQNRWAAKSSSDRGSRRCRTTARATLLVACLPALAACSQAPPRATPSAPIQYREPVSRGDARPAYDPRYGASASQRVIAGNQRIPKGGGTYKLGAPYRIAGRWYTPQLDPGYNRSGIASWYGADFHGRKTANGEIYDMTALSAAHPTLPLPSYVWVTNLANGRTLLVRVNDRGPYANDRLIDLSQAVARALDMEGRGLAQVRVRYAGAAPLDGNDQREQAFLRAQPWARSVLARSEAVGGRDGPAAPAPLGPSQRFGPRSGLLRSVFPGLD
jgi:rare lipoprotein A